jgi:hypothetical protein
MRRRALLTSLALLPLVALPGAGQAAAQLACNAVAIAPDEATSGAMLCLTVTDDGGNPSQRSVTVRTSHDHGRTWTVKRGLGLVAQGSATATEPSGGGFGTIGTTPTGLFYSAGYDVDRAMYVNLHDATGLMRSTDDGDTWTVAAPLMSGVDPAMATFTPYVDRRLGRVNQGGPVLYPIAVGQTNDVGMSSEGKPVKPYGSERLDPPAERVAVGTPEQWDMYYDLPDTGQDTGFAIGRTYGYGPGDFDVFAKAHTRLYGCDLDLTCQTLLHAWPDGVFAETHTAEDFGVSGRLYGYTNDLSYLTGLDSESDHIFDEIESLDRGRTWHRWAAVQALRAPAQKRGYDAGFTAVPDPAHPRHLLAVGNDFCTSRKTCDAYDKTKAHPVSIWESTDGGAHFRRLVSRERLVPGADQKERVQSLQLTPGGNLLALTGQEPGTGWWGGQYNHLWCSKDLGRHWTAAHC